MFCKPASLGTLFLVTSFWIPTARADLIVQRGNTLERYSDSGQDRGEFAHLPYTTVGIDDFVVAPGGDVFVTGNSLGSGSIYHFDSGGNLVASSLELAPDFTNLLARPRGLTIRNGQIYVGSSSMAALPAPNGVIQFDSKTLSFVGNALPLEPSASGLALIDVTSAADQFIYFATESQTFRAAVRSDNTLRLDLSFALAAAGEIEVRPNRPDLLYVAEGPRIHVYDFSGETVITPSGITYVNGFTFGPDGAMYVTATTSTGEELLKLDPDTGDVIQTLATYTGHTISSGGHGLASQFGTVAYQVPEPASVSFVALLVGLLARRR